MKRALIAVAVGFLAGVCPSASAGDDDLPPEVLVNLEGPLNAALKAKAMAEVCNLEDLAPAIKRATDEIVLRELGKNPALAGRIEAMGYYSAVYKIAFTQGMRLGLAPALDEGDTKMAVCRSAEKIIREGYGDR